MTNIAKCFNCNGKTKYSQKFCDDCFKVIETTQSHKEFIRDMKEIQKNELIQSLAECL